MEDVLYICHRLPFPPNKGDKIRSFHILKYLSEKYRVHLATFVDDPSDQRYVETVKELCADSLFVTISPSLRKLLSVMAVCYGGALSNRFYASNAIRQWVRNKVFNENISRAVLFSSPMAQFLSGNAFQHMTRIMDFVDVDSEKWAQYAEKGAPPISWIYQYEANRLRAYEKQICRQFTLSLFVSEQESSLFKSIAPQLSDKVRSLSNGVDTRFFDPSLSYDNPYEAKQVMVFTGAMDYWANIDAVCWFVESCFPKIREKLPQAKFYIVGIRPTEQVKQLAWEDGVYVTGGVKDIRPYIAHAAAVVAPLRIARGIQNKVLEAFSMAKQVVATPEAMEGIASKDDFGQVVASDSGQFAEQCVAALSEMDIPQRVLEHREFVLKNFSWNSHLSALDNLLDMREEEVIQSA